MPTELYRLHNYMRERNIHGRIQIIRTLVIRITHHLDRLGPSGKFVENSRKLTYLEITGYRIKYRTLLRLLELQIRHGRKVWTQVHTLNSNSRNTNCQFSPFSKKKSNYP